MITDYNYPIPGENLQNNINHNIFNKSKMW